MTYQALMATNFRFRGIDMQPSFDIQHYRRAGIRGRAGTLLRTTCLTALGLILLTGPVDARGMAGSYLVGQHAALQGDFGSAANSFSDVLEETPDFDDLRIRTISLLISDGRIDEAADLAEPLRERVTESSELATLQVVKEIKAGSQIDTETLAANLPDSGLLSFVTPFVTAWMHMHNGEAEKAHDVLANNPDDQTALDGLRAFHMALIRHLGELDQPEDTFAKLAQPDEEAARPEIILTAAQLMQQSGKTEEAKSLLQGWLDLYDDADLAYALDKIESGESLEPIVTDPVSGLADALYGFALALGQERGARPALAHSRFAEYLAPGSIPIKLLIGDLLSQMGDDEGANAIWSAIPEDSPHFWDAQLKLAGALASSEKLDEAEAIFRTLADERSDEIGPLLRLGDMFRRDEQYEKALEAYDGAIDRLDGNIEPRHWGVFYTRGIAHERTKNWPAAEKDFLKALELSPDHPFVLNYLGYSWVDQGMNYERAEDMLRKAVELRPQQGFIVDSLGWVFYKLGRYDEAVVELERAIELLPNDPVINDHLGDAYWQVGRYREARFQWNRALSFEPEDEEVVKIRGKLENGLTVPVNSEDSQNVDETDT